MVRYHEAAEEELLAEIGTSPGVQFECELAEFVAQPDPLIPYVGGSLHQSVYHTWFLGPRSGQRGRP